MTILLTRSSRPASGLGSIRLGQESYNRRGQRVPQPWMPRVLAQANSTLPASPPKPKNPIKPRPRNPILNHTSSKDQSSKSLSPEPTPPSKNKPLAVQGEGFVTGTHEAVGRPIEKPVPSRQQQLVLLEQQRTRLARQEQEVGQARAVDPPPSTSTLEQHASKDNGSYWMDSYPILGPMMAAVRRGLLRHDDYAEVRSQPSLRHHDQELEQQRARGLAKQEKKVTTQREVKRTRMSGTPTAETTAETREPARRIEAGPMTQEKTIQTSLTRTTKLPYSRLMSPHHPEYKRASEVMRRINRYAIKDEFKKPWELYVYESRRDRAYAIYVGDQGLIVIFSGSIHICSDNAMLAYLIGHELAHHLENHGVKKRNFYEESSYEAGESMRLQNEFDADRIGRSIAANAGYDPEGAARLVKLKLEHEMKFPLPPGKPGFRTHPPLRERLARLQEKGPLELAMRDQEATLYHIHREEPKTKAHSSVSLTPSVPKQVPKLVYMPRKRSFQVP